MNKRNFKAFLALLLTVVMVFSIVPMSVSAEETTATQVTDVADLAVGDQIVLVNQAGTKAMGAQSGKYRAEVDCTSNGDTVIVSDTMAVITLEAGSNDGTFALKVSDGYLYWKSSDNNSVGTNSSAETNGAWIITITDGVATIQNATVTERYLQYNATSPRFACYKTSSNQADPVIYKLPASSEDGEEDGGETPAVPTEASISFADKANRTEYSIDIQVWEQNGVTVTNNKAASTSDVGDYANPGRFYKSSETTIAFPGMTKIVVDCAGLDAKYVTPWSGSFTDSNATAVVEGTTVTITFANAVDTFTWTAMSAQARAYQITVYTGSTEGGEDEGGETPVVVPATLAEQLEAAKALANKTYLPYDSTITGTITNDPLASSYTAGSYDFTVSDGTNSVRCYFVPVTGGTPAKGDTVTVTGKLTAFNGSPQFDSTATATITKKAEGEGGETPDTPTVTFPFKDGDSFAIYYPAGGTVIGTLPNGAKLSYVEATLADGKITRESGMAEFTADFITDTVFCLIVDGKYLTSGATGNSLSLADEISDYAGWTLEAAENGWYIKNVNAAFNGNAQYIEFYSGFTTYGLNTSKADIYTFNFYALEGTVEEEEVVIYETPEEIVNAGYGLEDGQILSAGHKYTLTGVITSVDTAYDSNYKNVTVTIVVGGMTDKPIKVYRVKGEGADVIKVGDTITVTGVIKNYMGTIEFDQGCTLDSYTVATPDPIDPPATGDMIIVLVSAVLLAGAALVVVSRKRRFN